MYSPDSVGDARYYCGQPPQHPAHLSDDVENERFVPFSPSEPTDVVTEARAAFVVMIKEENFYMDGKWSHWSLKQHWSGAREGFADERLQKRWKDFLAGWKLAKGIEHHA